MLLMLHLTNISIIQLHSPLIPIILSYCIGPNKQQLDVYFRLTNLHAIHLKAGGITELRCTSELHLLFIHNPTTRYYTLHSYVYNLIEIVEEGIQWFSSSKSVLRSQYPNYCKPA